MLPSRIDIAPTEVLRIIKCNCSGNIGLYFSFENGRLGDTTWSIPLTLNVIKVYSIFYFSTAERTLAAAQNSAFLAPSFVAVNAQTAKTRITRVVVRKMKRKTIIRIIMLFLTTNYK